jgi:uncharacterized protein
MTRKIRKTEDEWFARHERDLIEELKRERSRREAQLAQLMKQEDARKSRELHHLKCPKCGFDMKEAEANRIIFHCTVCQGNFFGRNELEDALLKKAEERKGIRQKILRFLMHHEPGEDSHAELKNVIAEREQIQKKLAKLMQNENARKHKELHWRKCPNCGSDLKEIELGAGILVDECQVCKGIYLDTGETQEVLLQNEHERYLMRRKLLTMPVEERK